MIYLISARTEFELNNWLLSNTDKWNRVYRHAELQHHTNYTREIIWLQKQGVPTVVPVHSYEFINMAHQLLGAEMRFIRIGEGETVEYTTKELDAALKMGLEIR